MKGEWVGPPCEKTWRCLRVCGSDGIIDGARIIGLDVVMGKIAYSPFGAVVESIKDLANNLNRQLQFRLSRLHYTAAPNISMLILFGSTPRSLSAFSRSAIKPSGPQM